MKGFDKDVYEMAWELYKIKDIKVEEAVNLAWNFLKDIKRMERDPRIACNQPI